MKKKHLLIPCVGGYESPLCRLWPMYLNGVCLMESADPGSGTGNEDIDEDEYEEDL